MHNKTEMIASSMAEEERSRSLFESASDAIVRDVSSNEKTLRTIASGVTGWYGNSLYEQLVQSISKLFKVKYVYVAVLDTVDSNLVRTIAMSVDGVMSENMAYRLEGTPCEEVIKQSTCVYPSDVQTLFPDDRLLQDMEIESYLGTPLFNINKEPIGLAVILDIKPLHKPEQIQLVLEIFASRTSVEIERVNTEKHIRQLAYEDYLTGLPNRAALHENLTYDLNRCNISKLLGAMMIIDLDHFKTINDALSHDVGDDVLRLIGRRLQEIINGQGFLARMGGDEFATILIGKQYDSSDRFERMAIALANRIVSELSEPLYLDGHVLNVGASIGLVLFSQNGDNQLDILRRAEMALYCAKNRGRGNVQLFEPSLQDAANERLQMERGLRNAIIENELALNFQPQTNDVGAFIGVETLIRWDHPELGAISPARFIPVAEESGLILEIGEWVLNETCKQLKYWNENGILIDSHISVNVSAWQFNNSGFLQQINDILKKHSILPRQIVLELTESALLIDLQETIEKLKLLRKQGYTIAMDDFGTGYSSLAYLKDMEIDILKIDRVFVSELTHESEHPLVETIIAMGKHMNLEIIAEGVETQEQFDILVALGCKAFQGYHFSRPLAEKDFLEWLHKNQLSD